MKKSQIEKRLRNASDSFTPDVLDEIMTRVHQPPLYQNNAPQVATTKKHFASKKLIAAFAVILFIVAGIGIFVGVMNQDYQTIYLEINPSMEIVTNRFNRVKEIRYLNEDAQELFSGYDYKGKNVDSVVQSFVDLSYEKGYISEDSNNSLYIYVNEKNKDKAVKSAKRLKERIQKRAVSNNRNPDIVADSVSIKQRNIAREQNLSVAQMVFIEKILSENDSYTLDSLKNKSLKELKNILKQEQDKESNYRDDKGNGYDNPNPDNNGNGKQNGNQKQNGNSNSNKNPN